MAAEAVGTAYVIIRALTNQLSKDIKDGLDKGADDADVDAAGRKIGRDMGESAGDEFGETWNERSAEAIEDSADSNETKKAQKNWASKFFDRFGEHFDRGGQNAANQFNESFTRSIDDDDMFAGVDVDRAAGSFGSDLADEQGSDYDIGWKRNVAHTMETTDKDDSVRRGMSGVGLRMGEGVAEGASRGFTNTFFTGINNALSSAQGLQLPGGGLGLIGAQLGLVALGPGIQILGAVAGQAVAVLGFLGTAAAGAGLAFAGMAAAIVPTFLVLQGAFGIASDDLDNFNLALEGSRELWKEVGLSTQKFLLPALSEALIKLEDFIPMFSEFGRDMGSIVGQIAHFGAEELTTPENMEKIQAILDASKGIIGTLGGAGVALISPVLSVLEAAMPLAQRLADGIRGAVDAFGRWVDMKGADGLTTLFDKWYDRFAQIMRILGNLGGVLADVFGIGADSAEGMFDTLERWTQQWEDWTNSAKGQTWLTNFFENAQKIGGAVFGLVGDIFGMLFKPVADLGGPGGADAAQGIVDFIDVIRNEWLPAIESFGRQAYEALKGPVGEVFAVVSEFISTLAADPEIVGAIFRLLSANFFLFVGAMKALIAVMKDPIGRKIILAALSIAFFLKVLGTVKHYVGLALGPLNSLVQMLGFKSLGSFLTNPYVLLIAAIIAAVTLLYFHFKPFRDFVDTYIIDPIQRLWEAIGGVQGIVDWFKGLPALLERFWAALPAIIDNVLAFFSALPTTIPAFFSNIGKSIADFISGDPLGTMEETFHGVADMLRGLFDGVPVVDTIFHGIAAAFDALGSASGAVQSFFGWMDTAWDATWDFFENFDLGTFIQGFMDVTGTVGGILGDLVGTGFQWIIDNLPGWGTKIGEALGRLVPILLGALGVIALAIVGAFRLIGPAVLEYITRLPQYYLALLQALANIIMGFLRTSGILEAVQEYFPKVIDAIVSFFGSLPGYLDDVWQFLGDIGGIIADAIGTAIDFVVANLPKLGTLLGKGLGLMFKYGFKFLVKAFPTIIKILLATMAAIPGVVAGLFRLLGPAILTVIKNIPRLLLAWWKGMWNLIIAFLQESGILEAVQKYFPIVVDAIIGFFKNLPSLLLSAITTLGPLLGAGLLAFGKFVGEWLLKGLSNLGDLLYDVFDDLPGFDLLVTAFHAVQTAAMAVYNWIKGTLVPFFQGAFSAAMVVLGPIIRAVGTAWDGIVTAAKAVYNWIKGTLIPWLGDAFETAMDGAGTVIEGLGAAWNVIKWFAQIAWDFLEDRLLPWFASGFESGMGIATSIIEGVGAAWNAIKWFAQIVWDFLEDKVLPWFASGFESGMGIATSIIEGVGAAWNAIKWFAQIVWDFLEDKLLPWLAAGFESGMGIATGIINGVAAAWNAIKWFAQIVWDFLEDKLIPWLASGFENGMGVATGIINGVASAWNAIKWFAQIVWDFLEDKLLPWLSSGFKTGLGVAQGVISGFASAWNTIIWFATAVRDFFTGTLFPFFEGRFTDAVNGVKGIIDTFGGAFTTLKDTALTVYEWFRDTFSTVWEGVSEAVGAAADGIESAWDTVLDHIIGVINTIIEGINKVITGLNWIKPGKDIDYIPTINVSGGVVITDPQTEFEGWDDMIAVMQKDAQDKFAASSVEVQFGELRAGERQFAALKEQLESGIDSIFPLQPGAAGMGLDVESMLAGLNIVDTGTQIGRDLVNSIEVAMEDNFLDPTELANITRQAYAASHGIATAVGDPATFEKAGTDALGGFQKAWTSGATKVPIMTDSLFLGAAPGSPYFKNKADTFAQGAYHSLRGSFDTEGQKQDFDFGIKALGVPTSATFVKKTGEFAASAYGTLRQSFDDEGGKQDFRGVGGKINTDVSDELGLLPAKAGLSIAAFAIETVKPIILAAKLAEGQTMLLVTKVAKIMGTLPLLSAIALISLSNTISKIIDNAATAAASAASGLVIDVVSILRVLPALAGIAVAGLAGVLRNAASTAAAGMREGFSSGLQGFLGVLRSLDSMIIGAVGNLSHTLYSEGQQLVQGMINGINSKLGGLRAAAAAVKSAAQAASAASSNYYAGFYAMGGIVSQPTVALMGEAGREAIVPLTRPQQAMHVMRQAGLDQMVLSSPSAASSNNPLADPKGVSILTIEHADIFDKVDVDLIAAQMKRAYMSLPGR